MVWVNHSSVLKVFGALMLLVHWCDFDTVAYEFLDGSVTGPSTCCLASWNGMFFWYFTLMISFLIFHLGQLLTYAGWSPLQLAHFASFSHSWSSCPACPHFAHFASFLQYIETCGSYKVCNFYNFVSFFFSWSCSSRGRTACPMKAALGRWRKKWSACWTCGIDITLGKDMRKRESFRRFLLPSICAGHYHIDKGINLCEQCTYYFTYRIYICQLR